MLEDNGPAPGMNWGPGKQSESKLLSIVTGADYSGLCIKWHLPVSLVLGRILDFVVGKDVFSHIGHTKA